jgi:cytochrome c oxidase assembly factor CtaG
MLDGWKPDVIMAVPLAVTLSVYLLGVSRVRVPRLERIAFLTGWVVLVVALLSPIATISERLFSMHMTQHELLMLVAAPLITLGRPLVPMLWVLPVESRRRLKGGAGLTPVWSRLTSPAVVFIAHALALWIWHLPPLYQAAVLDDRIHAVQHLMFTGTACLFWWGLLRGRYGRLGYGAAVFYVFATAMHSGGLGALITFATAPIYPLYAQRATAGVDPLVDQQLAGLIMWIPAGVVLMIFGLALMSAWLGEAERRARLSCLLLAALCGIQLAAADRTISVATADPHTIGDFGAGVLLGADEAKRAATLLGRDFQLVTAGAATARVAIIAPAQTDIPTVAMRGTSTDRCVYVTATPEGVVTAPAGATVTDWHANFRRYGASELNERFEKKFSRPMTAEAWHGWVAVKAIVESALRSDDVCAELARLRFDGHKGRALRFDPVSRRLQHPALLVMRRDGKEIVEVVP